MLYVYGCFGEINYDDDYYYYYYCYYYYFFYLFTVVNKDEALLAGAYIIDQFK